MIDFPALAQAALLQAESLLAEWFPQGVIQGREFMVGNLRGDIGDSLRINLRTGKWADFADPERKGGDLISLYAAMTGNRQDDAARILAEKIGFSLASVDIRTVRPDLRHRTFGQPSAFWEYKSADRVTLGYIARYDTPNGKHFTPFSFIGGKWLHKAISAPRPLYGLDLLAERPTAPVLVVEGEKACDAARRFCADGLVCVTWSGGANAPQHTNWEPLRSREVLLWPDADAAGKQAMQTIGAILQKICPVVKYINPTDAPNKWDAADALTDGWTWEKFTDWAKPRTVIFSCETTVLSQNTTVITAPPDDAVSRATARQWDQIGIACSNSGAAIANTDNVLRILENWPKLKNLLWWDSFYGRYFTNHDEPREWTDLDELRTMTIIQRELCMGHVSQENVHQAAVIYARRHEKNEPQEWLKSLKWDGTARTPDFFPIYFGAESNDYSVAAGNNFWIGMIARIFKPGCQLDNMIVLEGPQGIGKTKSLRIIGGKWYTEMGESINSKDFFLALSGRFLVEIAELDSFNRADVTRIKQIVTCTVDRYRPPYGRASQDFPRSCVFVATTNENMYFKDPTGARRFWPIECRKIDFESLAKDREQLYAEAYTRFMEGESWYQMPSIQTEAEQQKRHLKDEWEFIIAHHIENRTEITITEICGDLKIPMAQLDMLSQRRIAGILRRLNWHPAQSNSNIRTWEKKQ